ncbi:putative enoyl-CoA delta isomerase 2, mitochondrial [Penaeus vannamei]|uniref:Putative enoyl-CoA delta isomerase 2, mitochondrial n=1 Tax=Penaeus vannamei TaxID=6689 RepID=A0A423U7Z3_PENVA|nr:enoyl-CoA delta isomerase 2, mitochondrial-like [Penaeus vannamei]XP_027237271.1 enoyl-CoA delta isomerase 2, mitochondrial-like [Penaeus vannamei]ROT84833.1 putative enoyl-CoA delta isomerase 2, mitochondrial [Penaeus vannamei]
MATNQEPDLVEVVKDGIYIIRFNRPKRKNAFNDKIMLGLGPALERAASNPDAVIAVVTGTGDYFTSGNDLSNFTKGASGSGGASDKKGEVNLELLAQATVGSFNRLVKAFIDFPKPLVAIVNGPAVGIGVTMLGLCDIVYATNRAVFHTPFVSLAQAPEGCSSYLFPRIMGQGKAAEMLVFGKKMNAEEACKLGLVTEVFPDEHMDQVWPRLHQWAKLPPIAMMRAKGLIRSHLKDKLHEVNDLECKRLAESWTTEEFMTSLMKFFTKKSKL